MIVSQSADHTSHYIARQLNQLFPDRDEVTGGQLLLSVKTAFERLDFCFSRVSHPRYNNGSESIYNHLYSDHNIVFYWLLANSVWKQTTDQSLSSKLYYLNKTMHGFDCMFDTQLPDIFLVFHGVGTMLGKATYSDYFVVMQGCTIGSNNGKYPVLGKGVSLTANSSVIGDCKIGDMSTISTGTLIFERDLENGKTAFLNKDDGSIEVKSSKTSYSKQFFKDYI